MGYDIKTKATDNDVIRHILELPHKQRSSDGMVLLDMFQQITGLQPTLWGSGIGNGIIGFGNYQYETRSGCAGNFMKTGFALRKANLVVYIMTGFKNYEKQLSNLGKHKHSVSCLYITKLANVNLEVLKEIIDLDYKLMCKRYPDPNIVYKTS